MDSRCLMLLVIIPMIVLGLCSSQHAGSSRSREGLVEVYYKEPPLLLLPGGGVRRASSLFVEVIASAPTGYIRTEHLLMRPGDRVTLDFKDVVDGWRRYLSGRGSRGPVVRVPTISISLFAYGDDGALYMHSAHVSSNEIYYAELGDWRLAVRRACENPLRIFEDELTLVIDGNIKMKPCYALKKVVEEVFGAGDSTRVCEDYEIIWPELYESRNDPPDTWFERIGYEGDEDFNELVHALWYWFADKFSKTYYVPATSKSQLYDWIMVNLITPDLYTMDEFLRNIYWKLYNYWFPILYWVDSHPEGTEFSLLLPYYGGELRIWNDSLDPASVNMIVHLSVDREAATHSGITILGVIEYAHEINNLESEGKHVYITGVRPEKYIAFNTTFVHEGDGVLIQYVIEALGQQDGYTVYKVTPIIMFIPVYSIESVDIKHLQVVEGRPSIFENATWSAECKVVYVDEYVECEGGDDIAYEYEDVRDVSGSFDEWSGGLLTSIIRQWLGDTIAAVFGVVLSSIPSNPSSSVHRENLGELLSVAITVVQLVDQLVTYTEVSYQSQSIKGDIAVPAPPIIGNTLVVSKLTLKKLNESVVENVPVIVKYFIDVGSVYPYATGGAGTHGEDLSARLMGVDCYAASGNMPYSASENASVQAGYLDEASSWLEFEVYPPISSSYTVSATLHVCLFYHIQGSGSVSLSAILEVYDGDHNLVARRTVEVFGKTSSGVGTVSKTVTISLSGITMTEGSTYYIRVKIAGSASVPTGSSGSYAWLDCYSWEDNHYVKLEELQVMRGS